MNEDQQKAQTILNQLGGSKFKVMTGVKNFLYAGVTETNKAFWLRMDIPRNAGGVNRLKVTLNANDTYTMHFYKQRIKNYTEVIITKETKYENIYFDKMKELFTEVTGMYTTL